MNIDSIMLRELSDIAINASHAILTVYQRTDTHVDYKDDGSPLTEADLKAHDIISTALRKLTPDIPVISEEDSETLSRVILEKPTLFWLVDPLDGSKEFIKRNGEFTVNIALIDKAKPILGIIAQPTTKKLYVGLNQADTQTAYETSFEKNATLKPISASKAPNTPLTLTGSRSHQNNEAIDKWMKRLETNDFHPIGSSLKFCLIATGKADLYVRASPTMLWDTAAGDAILQAAGGFVLTESNEPLMYHLDTLKNPNFIATCQKKLVSDRL